MGHEVMKIPEEIENDKNKQILGVLSGKSCHGDIIEPLEEIFSRLSNVESFCPDGLNFAWCCWYTNGVVFAYGVGMHEVGLRLPPMHSKQDERPGGFGGRWDGNEWWLIKWDSQSLERWALMAYECARNT